VSPLQTRINPAASSSSSHLRIFWVAFDNRHERIHVYISASFCLAFRWDWKTIHYIHNAFFVLKKLTLQINKGQIRRCI
jgi:hypothetical protein